MELYAAGGSDAIGVRRWSKILQFAQKLDDVEFRMRARYGLFLSHIQGGRGDLALVQAKNMLEDAVRVRDEAYIARLANEVDLFNIELQQTVEYIRRYGAKADAA